MGVSCDDEDEAITEDAKEMAKFCFIIGEGATKVTMNDCFC